MATKTIADYQADWAAANARGDQAAMDAAHAGAEAIRANSGYSGGDDGSGVYVTDQAKYDAYINSQNSSPSKPASSTPASSSTQYEPDYMALMQAEAAKANPNRDLLAKYEAARNAKIDAQGLGYGKTYDYIDLSDAIEQKRLAGQDYSSELAARNKKLAELAANGQAESLYRDTGKTYSEYLSEQTRKPVRTQSYRTPSGETVTTTTYKDAAGDVFSLATVKDANGKEVNVKNGYNFIQRRTDDDGLEYEDTYEWVADPATGKGTWRIAYSENPTDESYEKYLDNMAQKAIEEQNRAAVEKGLAEIKANWEKRDAELEQELNEAYLLMQAEEQNQALRNAMRGDNGGIGNKQYDSVQSNYDQAMLAIANAREQMVNEMNLAIAQLQAEGQMQAAQQLYEYAMTQLARFDEKYQFNAEMQYRYDALNTSTEQWNKEFALNRALSMLQQGYITDDAIEALGIPEEDARSLALYYSDLAQYDLAAAKNSLIKYAGNSSSTQGTQDTESTPTGLIEQEEALYQNLLATNGVPVYDAGENQVGIFFAPKDSEPFMLDARGNTITDPFNNKGYHINLIGRNLYWNDKAGRWSTTEAVIPSSLSDAPQYETGETRGHYNARMEYEELNRQIDDVVNRMYELNNKWRIEGNELSWDRMAKAQGAEFSAALNTYLDLKNQYDYLMGELEKVEKSYQYYDFVANNN